MADEGLIAEEFDAKSGHLYFNAQPEVFPVFGTEE